MKKTISLLLAVIFTLSVFTVVPFAGYSEPVLKESPYGKYMLAQGVYYFTDEVKEIDPNAFEEPLKIAVFTSENLSLVPGPWADSDTVIVINDFAKDSGGNDSKFCVADIAAKNGSKWFVYDCLSLFGKTVLAFFYEPVMSEEFAPCFEKLVKDTNPDYIYFDSLGGRASFYADGGASFADISGGAQTDPGFFTGLLMNFFKSLLEPKTTFYKNPGLDFLARLFKSFLKK